MRTGFDSEFREAANWEVLTLARARLRSESRSVNCVDTTDTGSVGKNHVMETLMQTSVLLTEEWDEASVLVTADGVPLRSTITH